MPKDDSVGAGETNRLDGRSSVEQLDATLNPLLRELAARSSPLADAGRVVPRFPVSMFVAIGFEHSVTSMFILPAGLLLGGGRMNHVESVPCQNGGNKAKRINPSYQSVLPFHRFAGGVGFPPLLRQEIPA